jgi:hypothetical protein
MDASPFSSASAPWPTDVIYETICDPVRRALLARFAPGVGRRLDMAEMELGCRLLRL